MGDQQLLTALRLVQLPVVVDNVVEQAHNGLQQLTSTLPGLPDEERKRALLRHLHATRQQLQRLHAVVSWSNKAKAVAEVKRLLEEASSHGNALRDAADQLAFLHGELEDRKAPSYDVPTAVTVLESGTYKLLPTSIEEQAGVPPQAASDAKRRAALRKVDFLLRAKLLAAKLPEGMVVVRVRDGVAEVAAPGQYTAELTLVPAPRDDVTLAKYRPPAEVAAAAAAAGPAVDVEVTQRPREEGAAGAAAAAEAAEAEQEGRSAAGEGSAAAGGSTGDVGGSGSGSAATEQGGKQQEVDRWRWVLVSFKLLPEWDSDTPAIAPNQAAWLQRQLEDKMWRAADVQQLQRLGTAGNLLHYPYATQQPKQGQQAAAAAASQRGGSTAASMLSTPPAGTAAALAEAAVAPALPADAAALSLLGSGMQPESSAQAQAPAKAPGAGQQQQQQQLGAGADAAAAGAPDWAVCPLSLLHSVLLQAAGRLTVYSLLLTEARRLEKASWEGLLSIKRSTGTGLRFSYWPHQPLVVTHAELQALRGSGSGAAGSGQGAAAAAVAAVAGSRAGATDAPGAAPALEVNLEEGGRLVCTHVPPLYSPLTDLPVELHLSPVSLSIEQLLLAAAAHNAATQLVAVQSALEADKQWSSLSITLQLVPPPASTSAPDTAASAAAPAGAAGTAGAPALLFRVAGDGAPFLALSMSLRTAKLVLTGGPALLECWQGGTGGQPGSGTAAPATAAAAGAGSGVGGDAAGSALTALVVAAQQRAERAQKDAATLPLASAPATVAALVQRSGSRAVLAAGLVAGELATLCRRLVRRRRLAGVVGEARGLGLLPGLPLPLLLLQRYFEQRPVPRPPLPGDALTLALPGFPAPRDMVCWEQAQLRQRQAVQQAADCIHNHRQLVKQLMASQQGAGARGGQQPGLAAAAGAAAGAAGERGGGGVMRGECGAVRCHLLVEYRDSHGSEGSEGSGPGGPALRDGQPGGGASEAAQLRLSLVVSSCTARSTVKQVVKVLPLPPHLLAAPPSTAASAAAAAAAARPGAKRKRGAGEEDVGEASVEATDSAWGLGHALPARPEPSAAVDSGSVPSNGREGRGGSSSGGGGGSGAAFPPLQGAVQWCREAAVWEQALMQLRLLRVPFVEELWPGLACASTPRGHTACMASAWQQAAGDAGAGAAGSCRRVLRLSCPPALSSLERWAAERQRVGATSPGHSTGNTACSSAATTSALGDGLGPEGHHQQQQLASARIQPGVVMELDPCSLEGGAWTTSISSTYLSQLHELYSQLHVRVALPALPAAADAGAAGWACSSGGDAQRSGGGRGGAMQQTRQGLVLRHEQRRGESALTAVSDVLRVLRLHTCIARLASLMLAHPFGPHRQSGSTLASHQLGTGTYGSPHAIAAQQTQHVAQQQQQPAKQPLGSTWDPFTKGVKSVGGGGGWQQQEQLQQQQGPAGNGGGQIANGYYSGGANGIAGSNGGLGGTLPAATGLGAEAGGQQVSQGEESKGAPSALCWPLPLCATVALTEVGLAHVVLTVTPVAPPALAPKQQPQGPEGMLASAQAGSPEASSAPPGPIPLRVEWVGRYGGPPATSASLEAGSAAGVGAASSLEGLALQGSDSGGGFVRCQLAAEEPALPGPLLEALAAQLEAGCESEFLDSLCLAAAPAAVLSQAVSPAALRAAGLLPGAARLLPVGCTAAMPPSPLRLALRAQHAGRVLQLQFEFARGGYTLVRLLVARGAPYPSWAEAAWARASQLPAWHAAADVAGGLQQAKQGWCGLGSLAAAVAELLRGLVHVDGQQ